MNYEPMKDSYQAFLDVQPICPKCGLLMNRTCSPAKAGEQLPEWKETVVCINRACALHDLIFEAPSVELKRFIPKKEEARAASPQPAQTS